MTRHRIGLSAFALLLMGLATVPGAGAQVVGSGALSGSGSLAARRCGSASLRTRVQVVVAPDGTWVANTNDGATFSGTSVPAGTSGRRLDLTFDPEAEAGFVTTLAEDLAELCRRFVEITSFERTKFLLKTNRRGTRARLILRYTGTGTANGRAGTFRSGFTLHGLWTPG